MKRLLGPALAVLLLAVPCIAMAAQDGYVTDDVSLRAGPDMGYPLIDVIPAGSEIYIEGCTTGWEWCDVVVGGNRGWVDGYYVEYEYGSQRVLLPDYGARIGIPIISFSIGAYWGSHYRHRPFYRERSRWYRHRPSHRSPPRPHHGRSHRSEHRSEHRSGQRSGHRTERQPDRRGHRSDGHSSQRPSAPRYTPDATRRPPPVHTPAHPRVRPPSTRPPRASGGRHSAPRSAPARTAPTRHQNTRHERSKGKSDGKSRSHGKDKSKSKGKHKSRSDSSDKDRRRHH